MFTYILLALFGYSAIESNTSSLTDWTKAVIDSNKPGSHLVPVESPSSGGYLIDGVTEIDWADPEERPVAFTPPPPMVMPEPVKTHKTVKTAPDATKTTVKQLGGTDDLGLLDKSNSNLGVNTDEILSYFEKTPIKKTSDNDTTLSQPATTTPATPSAP